MGANIHLRFPSGISTEPVVCNLVRLYDLDFNISTAQISAQRDGFMTLELLGRPDNIDKAMEYLRDRGIEVTMVAQRIRRDEQKCAECGVCTAICPTHALSMTADRHLSFNDQKCVTCLRCVKVCPVKAISADIAEM